MYNYNHLYYFYVTAKSGGVSSAATRLKISQPSLSSQLKVLERSLAVTLFHKVGRNNVLTEAGTMIYNMCRQMFEISEELDSLIAERVPTASRRINIGVSDEVDRPFVVEVVSAFLKQHGLTQRPKVSVVSGSHGQLVERLRFHELDAVVTPFAMIEPELENLSRAEVPVALTCSSKWLTRSNTGKLSATDAVKQIIGWENAQWLMPSSRFKLRAEIDSFFEKNQLKGRIVFESDVMSSLVRSVVDEVGMAFIPLLYVAREIREKSIRVLGPKGGYWKYRVWLTCHSQNKDDDLVKSFSRAFKDVCDQAIS